MPVFQDGLFIHSGRAHSGRDGADGRSDQNSPAGSGVIQNLMSEIIGSEEGHIKKLKFG